MDRHENSVLGNDLNGQGGTRLYVDATAGESAATLAIQGRIYPAMLGRTGPIPSGAEKKEGDGGTPLGVLSLRQVYFRPDRRPRPVTGLPVVPIRPDDLWCDDPAHALYNRPVRAPFSSSAEKMWRESRVYDVVIVLDWNLSQPVPGRGSAIFFHLTSDDISPKPTEGCVAVSPNAMSEVLPNLSVGSTMDIRLA